MTLRWSRLLALRLLLLTCLLLHVMPNGVQRNGDLFRVLVHLMVQFYNLGTSRYKYWQSILKLLPKQFTEGQDPELRVMLRVINKGTRHADPAQYFCGGHLFHEFREVSLSLLILLQVDTTHEISGES